MRKYAFVALGVLIATLFLVFYGVRAAVSAADDASSGKAVPAKSGSAPQSAKKGDHAKMEKAMFGAGCFWGVEATFRKLDGVTSTAVGYAGGKTKNPSYEDVCTDATGHAEVVQVTFDPSKIPYEKLLDVFWKSHDPTQVNRQGPDHGTQYRSVIFYYTPEQKAAAEKTKAELEKSGKHRRSIATQIESAPTFWKAEDYHQQYLEKRGLASCHINLQE